MVVGGSKMSEWHTRPALVHALRSLKWDSKMVPENASSNILMLGLLIIAAQGETLQHLNGLLLS